jgi:hypothetical protein
MCGPTAVDRREFSRFSAPSTPQEDNVIKTGKWFIGAAVMVSVGLGAHSAWSGKPERDKVDALTPKVKATKDAIKSNCGCDVAVDVKFDGYKAVEDMNYIERSLDSLGTTTKNYCVKDADKKAFCSNVNKAEYTWADSPAAPKMDGKTLKIQTNKGTWVQDSALTAIFNKF